MIVYIERNYFCHNALQKQDISVLQFKVGHFLLKEYEYLFSYISSGLLPKQKQKTSLIFIIFFLFCTSKLKCTVLIFTIHTKHLYFVCLQSSINRKNFQQHEITGQKPVHQIYNPTLGCTQASLAHYFLHTSTQHRPERSLTYLQYAPHLITEPLRKSESNLLVKEYT